MEEEQGLAAGAGAAGATGSHQAKKRSSDVIKTPSTSTDNFWFSAPSIKKDKKTDNSGRPSSPKRNQQK